MDIVIVIGVVSGVTIAKEGGMYLYARYKLRHRFPKLTFSQWALLQAEHS